jgi:hypothetical protein
MKKTIALLAAGLVAVVVLAKTTSLSSYVGTAWCQARNAAKHQVPTEFEIERISHDINNLDQALERMIRPIAEHKISVERLREEIARGEARVAEQKKILLDATSAVKNAKSGERLTYGNKQYTAKQVETRIALDFESFKRLEATVAAQRKLLTSREETLRAAQDQLATFMSKKEEFRLQLAQLRAEHEVNKVSAVGSNVEIDTTPLSGIAKSLGELKDRIDQQRVEMEYRNGILAVNGLQLNQPQQTANVDLDAIQAHLENGATTNVKTTAASR